MSFTVIDEEAKARVRAHRSSESAVPALSRSPRSPSPVPSMASHRKALAELAHVRDMYRRLDAHNDGLEGALRHLRGGLDALRFGTARRMRHALREIRTEWCDLRAGTAALLQSHALDMALCRKRILRGLRAALLAQNCAAESSGDEREEIEEETEEETEACRGKWRAALRRQREGHRRHLRTMREVYEQKEKTMQQQIDVLQRLVAANIIHSSSRALDNSNGNNSNSNHNNNNNNSHNNSAQALSGSWPGGSDGHTQHNESHRGQLNDESFRLGRNPVRSLSVYDDVERRVRSRWLRCQAPVQPNPVTLREERFLSEAARRLISAVGQSPSARPSHNPKQRAEGLSDIETVARGVWAEQLLKQRSAGRPITRGMVKNGKSA